VLDAFAGTGALGLEALSRGASGVTFVERDRREIRVLEANVAACGVQERVLSSATISPDRRPARHPARVRSCAARSAV
jgi:16S rRNA (guanine966-N2)-methyltransferase